jgi:hypothetical protein
MIVSFTGTQTGMTQKQKYVLEDLLDELHALELHHGDCIGADEEAHIIALIIGMRIVIHPPDDDSKRAFCKLAAEVREPKPYLVRNDDIAEEGEVLIATPKEYEEKVRSGTWATVRYARKKGRDIFIILPDGRVIIG